MHHRLAFIVTAAATAALIGASCSPQEDPDDASSTSATSTSAATSPSAPTTSAEATTTTRAVNVDASISVHVFEDPVDLAPTRSENRGLMRYVYDPLAVKTLDGKYVGVVSSSWSTTPTSASFVVRTGVTCADGSTLGPDQVVASLQFALDASRVGTMLTSIDRDHEHAVTLDAASSTVTVTSSAPEPFLFDGLLDAPMICAAGLAAPDALAERPAGSGPYTFASRVPGDRYVFTRRAAYTWGAGGAEAADRLPREVVVRIVPDQSAATNLLLTGDLDIGTVGGADKKRIRDAGLTGPSLNQFNFLLYANHDASRATSEAGVRRAVLAAVDAEGLRLTAGDGEVDPAKRIATVGTEGCGTTLDAMPVYDLDAAAKDLSDAGWARQGDGWAKGGKPLELTLVHATEIPPNVTAGLEYLLSVWKKAGIVVKLEALPRANIVERTDTRVDWDLHAEFSGQLNPVQLGNYVSGPMPPGGNNFTRTTDPQLDTLLGAQGTASGDAACTAFNAAEARIMSEGHIAPLFAVTTTVVLHDVDALLDARGNPIPGTLAAFA